MYSDTVREEIISAFDFIHREVGDGYEMILHDLSNRLDLYTVSIKYYDGLHSRGFVNYYIETYAYITLGELMDTIVLSVYGVKLHETPRFC